MRPKKLSSRLFCMGHLAEGARIVFGDRRNWRYILIPWIWSLAILLGIMVLGYALLVPWLLGWINERFQTQTGALFANLIYILFWIFAAGFVFITITSFTSSFLWDDLSQKVEEKLTGRPAPQSSLKTSRVVSDSLSRGAFAIAMTFASLFCGWLIPIVGPVLIAGWLGVLDYTSPTFIRYNRTVGQQWPVATRMKGWFGFQLLAGALTLLPVVNVLLLPVMVAGGTVMAVRSKILEAGTQNSAEFKA